MDYRRYTYCNRYARIRERRRKNCFDTSSPIRWPIKRLASIVIFCLCAASSHGASQDYSTYTLTSTQGFTIYSGGEAVSSVGDMNGDGLGDVAVGISLANANGGIAYVLFGNSTAILSNVCLTAFITGPTTGFRIFSASAGEQLGKSISNAGDVNGDGRDDLIVGAWGGDFGSVNDAGISYVIFGRKVSSTANAFTDIQLPDAELDAAVGFRILGGFANRYSGYCVSGAGDVNHDGMDDVVVGGLNSGVVYVVFGKNMTGSSVAFGDVFLSTITTSSTIGFRILAVASDQMFSHSVSHAGDVNGDGISDIIIGAYLAGLVADSNAGISYVIFGHAVPLLTAAWSEIQLLNAALANTVGFRILGAAEGDFSGAHVSYAGDVNGDGVDDVIIGAAEADPLDVVGYKTSAGITYIIFGRNVPGGAPAFGDIELSSVVSGSTIGFRILGANSYEYSGSAVSTAGDFNGDGVSDFVIGARYFDKSANIANSGVSYVIFGRKHIFGTAPLGYVDLSTMLSVTTIGFRLFGSAAEEQSGYVVSNAGDVNGDGLDDIIVGSIYGPSTVIYGVMTDPTSHPRNLQTTSAPSTQEVSLSHLNNTRGFRMSLGSAVNAAGDLNGDGVDDLIVGAFVLNQNAGVVYVVFGNVTTSFEDIDFATRVSGPTTGFRILAPAAGYSLGIAVSKAGDVNGDGVDDVILGAQGGSPGGRSAAGISYVIFGRTVTSPANAFEDIQLPLTAMAASVGFRILGAGISDLSGTSVSGAGAVNGDGIDDVIVGAYCADPPLLSGDSNGGIAYVVFGKNMTGITTAFGDVELSLIVSGSAQGVRILAVSGGDQLGFSVSRAGDVNHDGISDVIVAARSANAVAGISYVIFGHKMTTAPDDIQITDSALPSHIGFRILGGAPDDYSGISVSYAGDVNGDGIDDVIVGAAGADPPALGADSNAGITYIIYGRDVPGGAPAFGDIYLASFVSGSTVGFRIFGATANDFIGCRVADAGDVNGDGVGDIIIGAQYAKPQPSKANGGISYVIYGQKSFAGKNPFSDIDLATLFVGSHVGYRVLGATAQDQSGNGISSAGDINGDGFDDVMIGTVSGPSYVIYGMNSPVSPTSQPSSQPSLQPSRQPSSQPSLQPSRQPSRQPTTQPSRQPTAQPTVQPTSAPQELSLSHLDNTRGFTMTAGGSSVNGAGDINGDGIDDIIMGAYWANGNDGRVYVLFGKKNVIMSNIDLPTFTTGLNTGFRIHSLASGSLLGWCVGAAGDVNGDGVDDIIMGARFANPTAGKVNAGISYVIFGRKVTSPANAFTDIQLPTTAMAASVGFRILGAAAGDSSGYTVSGAGDVNGDGIDDIIIGAYLADPPALPANSDAGAAYVIFGKNLTGSVQAFGDVDLALLGTGSTVGFRILGAVVGDQCGFSVSSAGDINGDGISDIIVGANQADPPGQDGAGIAYVLFGRKVTSSANAFEDVQLTETFLASTVGFRILGSVAGGGLGVSISPAGDINGDGLDDVIIGAPTTRVTYVIFGRNVPGGATPFSDIQLSSTALPATIGFRILAVTVSDNSGFSVAGVGDVNDDGVDDVLIGARYGDPSLAKNNAGISYVVYGRKSIYGAAVFGDVDLASITLGSLIGFRILGAATNDVSGYTVSGAGDVNGDGVADMMVGTQTRNSYVIYGIPASPTSQPSGQPSLQPSASPTSPTSQPTSRPSTQPSRQPSSQPSLQPVSSPSSQPSSQPSKQPTCQPSAQPSLQPSSQSSSQPLRQPSSRPSRQPSGQPTSQPISLPSSQPSSQPSRSPTLQPSSQPSRHPSSQPSLQPISSPSSQPSSQPSKQPTCQPSAQPSLQPTIQPTWQPSNTPSGQPSQQPSGWPSNQPSSSPSCQPSSQPTISPSAQPSTQPSVHPTAQPSVQPSVQPLSPPSAQPSCQPSTQPSSLPSLLPSLQPSAQPSVQPSAQPGVQPSTSPGSQPSSQPSVSPSVQPTSQPTSPPSTQPSRQPSCQPSGQPSAQPSQLPRGAPSSQPTTSPTSVPTVSQRTDTWVTALEGFTLIGKLSTVSNDLWVCGQVGIGSIPSCAVIGAPGGVVVADYKFPWTDVIGVLQTEDASRVVVIGHVINPSNVVTSEAANCMIGATHLVCVAKSFYDTTFAAVTYAPFPKKIMYAGVYSTFATVSIDDAVTGAVKSYLYTSSAMQSVTISHAVAPPSFVGAFVTGTCVSTNGASNYIVSGMVRTDSGAMSAVYLAPMTGSILNRIDLVTAMTLEFVNPDSFIAGGLQLSTTPRKHAYLVRLNALIGSIKYSKRYRATTTGSASTEVRRRMLGETVSYSSVTRGMVLLSTVLYMIVDVTSSDD